MAKLTNKLLATHGFLLSTVAKDALVLMDQVISAHSANQY